MGNKSFGKKYIVFLHQTFLFEGTEPCHITLKDVDIIYRISTFVLFQALEAVNTRLRELYPDSEELFDIVLVTYNHAHVGVRLINTINHHSE